MQRFTFIFIAFIVAFGALPASAATVAPGTLVKASLPAVYYVNSDGKRLVFPNEATYRTWYSDFSSVKLISDAELSALPIGGNVTYRPGSRMLKIQSSPVVYAVAYGGVLRPISSESVAAAIYGSNWNTLVDDLPDSFFVNYKVGAAVNAAADFVPSAELASSITIDPKVHATASVFEVSAVSITQSASHAAALGKLVIDPRNENIALAADANAGGIFRTVDRGNSWQAVSGEVANYYVSAISVDSEHPDTIYAGTAGTNSGFKFGGIFVSRSNGQSWQRYGMSGTLPQDILGIATDPSDPKRLLVAGWGSIFVTADEGASWNEVLKATVTDIRRSMLDSDVYFALGEQTLYRSTDRGEHWVNLGANPDNGLPEKKGWYRAISLAQSAGKTVLPNKTGAIYLAYTEPFQLFRSDDNGLSWREMGKEPYEGMRSVFAADPTNADVVLTGGLSVHRSYDGGWSVTDVANKTMNVTSIVFAPSNPMVVYLVSGSGLEISFDGGYEWTKMNGGFNTGSWEAIDFGENGTILEFASGEGLYRREVDGSLTLLSRSIVYDLQTAPSDRKYSYVSYDGQGIARSTDNGKTYLLQNTFLPAGEYRALCVDPSKSSRLLVGVGSALYLSVDGAAHWTLVPNNTSGATITAITISGTSVWIGRADGTVALVQNVDTSPSFKEVWKEYNQKSVASIVNDGEDVMVALDTDWGTRVARIENNGDVWVASDVTTDLPELTRVISMVNDPAHAHTMYLGTRKGLFMGTDHGMGWQWHQISDMPSVTVHDMAVDPASSRVIVSVENRGLYELKR